MVDAVDDGLEVLEALDGLLGNAAFHELARRRVDGKLRRDVVVVGERHRLRRQVALRSKIRVPRQYYVIAHK